MRQFRDGRTTFQNTNRNVHTFTISHGEAVGIFKLLTPGQFSHVQPMSLEQLVFVSPHPEEANRVINQRFQTSHSPVDPSTLNLIKRRIYDEILSLRKLEKLDQTLDEEQRKPFVDQFNWKDS